MLRQLLIGGVCVQAIVCVVRASDPWADEVVDHSPELDGAGLYNDPLSLLGMPATTYWDPFMCGQFQVSLLVPAFNLDAPDGNKLITTIPSSQFVKVKFDEPVEDDPRNPYGLDLLVFGNSFFEGDGYVYPGMDMETYYLKDGGIFEEPVTVAVSSSGIGDPQTDPQEWYVYDSGPYADSWFPTNAYEWDRAAHDWGDPLDYTTPVDPSLGSSDFAYLSATDAIDLYEWSGGGTGIDLAESGFSSIQYVHLTSKYASDSGEIGALADVFPSLGDFDRDGDLDLQDFARFQACYTGADNGPRPRECFYADFDGDRDVDADDYAQFESFLAGPNQPPGS